MDTNFGTFATEHSKVAEMALVQGTQVAAYEMQISATLGWKQYDWLCQGCMDTVVAKKGILNCTRALCATLRHE